MKTKNKGSIILTALVLTTIALGALGYEAYKLMDEKISETKKLGAFRPSEYTGKLLTRLNEGGVETTFNTTPGTAKDGTTLTTTKIGDFVVITINPGATNAEKISASAVSVSGTTATWTIINRGLSFTENVAVTANKKQHSIGETVIISNDDHFLSQQYVNVDDAQTISGVKTFSASPIVPAPTTDLQAATKKYADDLAIAGSPDASETVKGIIELATATEARAGTATGDTTASLVIPNSLATSSNDVATTHLVVTEADGKIKQNFLDLTEGFTHTGAVTFNSATTSLNSTTTIAANSSNRLQLNGLQYIFPTTMGASSTSLTTDGSGNLSWQYPYYYYPTVASANTKISLDTATTTNLATLIKARTAYVNASGKMRISVDLKNADGSTYTEARIYINDVAVGAAQQVVGTNFVTKSQDLFVRTGDEVSVYFRTENASFTATLQNFRIKYDRTATTSEGYVITN